LTDWTWSQAVSSVEWDLMIEKDVAPRDPSVAATGGYYWSYAFNFEQGVAGRVGLQSEGIYQSVPSDPIEVTKMAVFWLSGPPMAAELGDIPFPEARVAETSAAGADWLTIHARFAWQECHVYRIRFGPESTNPEGNTWYGLWILDTTEGNELFLGRMLLPPDVGLLSPFSSSRTTPIEFGPSTTCEVTVPVSAIFGTPVSGDGLTPTRHTNRFESMLRCSSSRFTDFVDAVRHELAVVP
jgi:hypothetical protein